MNDCALCWLVYSREHNAWWRPGGGGYTVKITEAGRFTLDEATKICEEASWGGPILGGPPEFMMADPEQLLKTAPHFFKSEDPRR